MTEYWKSNKRYFCEYCGVWMADNAKSRALHEGGLKHKDNVARRLREMREKEKQEKRHKEHVQKELATIEAEAKARFDLDNKKSDIVEETEDGNWIFHQESGYYYNSKERYYYDKASGMYYGGDPPNWTSEPKMPNASLFGANKNVNTTKDDIGTVVKQIQKPKVYPSGMKVTHAHPLAGIGGYQMPTQGTIGGARGLDVLTKGNTSTASGKSKRSENGAKMSTDEEAFLARREAARKRVEKRTMDAFGMK